MKIASGIVGLTLAANTNPDKPNVLFILSDDQGFADVPWKSSRVRLPELEKLRRTGMTIDGAYSQPRCTPSRVSFMTGKYPWKIGVQSSVFQMLALNGIRPKETLLPQLMKDAGYNTHMFGKWHLGFCDEALLPTSRGFDTFHGFWSSGGIQYYNHAPSGGGGIKDYWMTDSNGNLVQRETSLYSTDEFTNDFLGILDERVGGGDDSPFFTWMAYNAPHSPFEAPANAFLDEFADVSDRDDRQTYLAMLQRMDTNIGRLVTKLEQTGELANTIIIFQSDNGPNAGGSAFPLRAVKGAFSEGGMRVPAFITGPGIPSASALHRTQYMHLIDWAPTILDFAGVDPSTVGVDFDGLTFKDTFMNGADGPRTELFHAVQTSRGGSGIYRKGDFKIEYKSQNLIFPGTNHTFHDDGICDDGQLLDDVDYTYQDIFDLSGTVAIHCLNERCNREVTMFNIRDDPYELVNVYDDNSALGDQMVDEILAQLDNMEEAIDTSETTDENLITHAQYPENTRWTTYGWCDANNI